MDAATVQKLTNAVQTALNRAAAFLQQTNAALRAYEPLVVVVVGISIYVVLHWVYELLFDDAAPFSKRLKEGFFRQLKRVPFVRNKIKKSIDEAMVTVRKSMIKPVNGVKVNTTLPAKPVDPKEISAMMKKLSNHGDFDSRRQEGRVTGTIYVGGQHYKVLTDLVVEAFREFTWTNPLHTGIFPGVRQMEAEVVAMTISVFNGGPETCGALTSGGTESILMAMKTYRDRARSEFGITRPNVVAPRTCHPAFDKACQYLGIEIRHVHEDRKTFSADVKAMAQVIDSNTISLIGSCPQYPHGAIDPIEDLGKLAKKHGIGLHVDCCLGSFLVPFLREAGDKDFPLFDFRVDGVTSISADTHKFGYGPKGSSVIMYHSPELRKHQFSVFPDWPGGIYGTPNMAGSRPGAIVAGTWAAMLFHGRERYVENAKSIMRCVHILADGIRETKGLRLLVEPRTMVVAFTSDGFDINRLIEPMEKRGWDLGVLQFPSSIHIGITMSHTEESMNNLVRQLREEVAVLMKTPNIKAEGAGAMYGMAQALPDRSIVDELVRATLGAVYVTENTDAPQNGHKKHD